MSFFGKSSWVAEVEVDETFIGGKAQQHAQNRRHNSASKLADCKADNAKTDCHGNVGTWTRKVQTKIIPERDA